MVQSPRSPDTAAIQSVRALHWTPLSRQEFTKFKIVSKPSQSPVCPHRQPPAFGTRAPGEGARGCTRRQPNAHITKRREVCYPWHPWFGRVVTIREVLTQRHQTVFHCRPEPDDGHKALALPEWMFDRAVCCTMQLAPRPRVSGEVLCQLEALLSQAADGEGGVLQDQYPCLTSARKTDAWPPPTKSRSNRSLSSSPANAELADATEHDPGANADPASPTAARASVPGSQRHASRGAQR